MKPYFSVGLRRGAYEIVTNRPGLSDGHFAMLISGVGTQAMILIIVLAAVGFLACAFFLFVLFQ